MSGGTLAWGLTARAERALAKKPNVHRWVLKSLNLSFGHIWQTHQSPKSGFDKIHSARLARSHTFSEAAPGGSGCRPILHLRCRMTT